MKIIGMYAGSNLPFFKEFELDLNYEGVTVIRGLNLNVKGMKDRNNGSGKTLLLSGLAEILISSNPTIERNELIARKALFPNPNSQITIDLDSTIITKGRFGGASVSYGIESDGGGIEKVKKEISQQYLAENIGYNEDSFYSLVYLDGSKDFPLIVGSATQRIQFLSNIFSRVEVFDQLFQLFSGKAKEFGSKVNTYYTLEEELAEIRGESEDDDVDEDNLPTEEDVAEIRDTVKKLKKDLEATRNQLSNSEMANTYSKLTDNIERISKKLGIDADIAERRLAEEVARKRIDREYRSVKVDYEGLTHNIDTLETKISELEDSDTDDSQYDLLENASASSRTYKEWASEIVKEMNWGCKALGFQFRIKEFDSFDDLLDAKPIIAFMLACLIPTGDIIGKQNSKSPYRHAFDMDGNEKLALTGALTKVDGFLDKLITKRISVGSLGESFSEKDAKRIRSAHKRKLKLEDLREELQLANDDLKVVKSKLSGLSRQEIMPIKDYDLLASMVQDLKTLSSLGMKKVMESLSESKIESLKKKARQIENEIVDLNSKCAEMEASIEFAAENKSVVEGLQEKMNNLHKYTEAVPIIESLKRAFGNKGIRVTLINQLTNALARRMNAKAHLVFPEPMLFDFQLSEKTCDIMVTRNAGTKGELTSDIRVLSQSERKSFSLLLMYCLLPMTPSSSRLNIAVLDEMTSNMDHPTKVKVFREFIPALREVVPHIILADTGNLEIDDAREYTVVKKGNVSKLVESENVYQETK